MSNSDKSRSGSSARDSRAKSSGSEDIQRLKKRSASPRRSHSKSRSSSRSQSRSRSFDKHRRYRSKSRSADRSRSRSPYSRSKYNGRDKGRYGSGGGGVGGGGAKKYRNDSRSFSRSRSRSPMSGRRRHLADRENPPKSRCLGVFGLSLHTRERDLYDVFSRYGEVEDVQLVYDNHSGRSRGFSFIYFATPEDAAEAKERAHGMELDGRNIRCDYSITERAHTPTPGVYLGKPSRRRSPRSPPPSRYRSRYSRSRSRSYDRYERHIPRRFGLNLPTGRY